MPNISKIRIGTGAENLYDIYDASAIHEQYVHPSYSAKTVGNNTTTTLTHGGTFKVPKVVRDASGHISDSTADITLTLPAAYTHPIQSTLGGAQDTKGLYKISYDALGHISGVEAVTKEDIADLGVAITDTVYSHPTYTAKTAGETANKTLTYGGTFKIPYLKSDASGHVTGDTKEITLTMPTQYSHPTYTAKTVGNNTTTTLTHGGTFVVPKVVRDASGHISDTTADIELTLPDAYTHPTYTAKTVGNNTTTALTHGGTFKVPKVVRDASGHISNDTVDITLTLPAAYTHPVYGSQGTEGLYKIITDGGHVTSTKAVVENDLPLSAIKQRVTNLETITGNTGALHDVITAVQAIKDELEDPTTSGGLSTILDDINTVLTATPVSAVTSINAISYTAPTLTVVDGVLSLTASSVSGGTAKTTANVIASKTDYKQTHDNSNS